MIIKSADFVNSNTDWAKCPEPKMPEYAFIGRSNVGKSSLINMLVDRKKMAKTSSTPGKTQLINHFLINASWYLTDLPGYGYAKVSKAKKGEFAEIITEYILNRKNLINLFVLIDSRIPPQKIDLEFMEWCGESEIPFSIVYTKLDKLTKGEAGAKIEIYKKELLTLWEELPPIFISSAEDKRGKEDLLAYITQLNDEMIDMF